MPKKSKKRLHKEPLISLRIRQSLFFQMFFNYVDNAISKESLSKHFIFWFIFV